MNVKKYTAGTLAEAMEQIKAELGPDAFILQQRSVRRKGLPGLFHKPQIEVTAAYETKNPQANRLPPLVSRAPQEDFASQLRAARENLPDYRPSVSAQPPVSQSASRAGTPGTYAPPPGRRPVILPQEAQDEKFPDPPEETAFVPLSAPPVLTEERVVGRVVSPGASNVKIAALENKIDALSSSIDSLMGRMARSHDARGFSPEVDSQLVSLYENETHEEFISKIGREISDIVTKQKADTAEVTEQILRQYIGQPEPIKLKRFKRTVVMLVGPTGVGKTTTLAKLAAIYSINHHAKVGVITTDTYRIAAVEQLKTYTQILEIPLSIVYTPEEIVDALKEHEGCDVVFIDTAGKSPSDKTHEEEITALIRHSDCDEVHLVLSATTSFAGMLGILSAYSFLADYRVIFTKLDETPTWGGLLNARFMSDRPLSYVTTGQAVPDDIEVADTRKIVEKLMTR